MQAKLRAEVYKALDDESAPKPELCKENFLINELIREYLVYNHYSYTNSLLLTGKCAVITMMSWSLPL